jgi:hypothetical protein
VGQPGRGKLRLPTDEPLTRTHQGGNDTMVAGKAMKPMAWIGLKDRYLYRATGRCHREQFVCCL